MELLYLSDTSQLDFTLDSRPDLLDQMRPITGDMIVSFELEKRGINFIDEWGFIKPEEIEQNWNEAHTLSTNWWNENIINTEYGVEALTVSAQQDLVYAFQACLNARTIYRQIFDIFSVEKISGFFLPSVGTVRTGPSPTYQAVRSVSEAVLFHIAEKNNIKINKLYSDRPLAHRLITSRKSVNSRKIKLVKKFVLRHSPHKVVVIYRDLMADREFNAIKKSFEELPEIRLVIISQRELCEGMEFRGETSEIEKKIDIFGWQFFETCKNYTGDIPEIFANSHLNFQFERVISEMKTAVRIGDIFSAFLDVLQPSLVIFGHEAFTIERTLVGLAQKRGIVTVAMLHGGVMPKMGIRAIAGRADYVLVWDKTNIEMMASYGVERSRLKLIGSVRFEEDYLQYVATTKKGSSNFKQAAKDHLGVDVSKPLIMLATAEINTGLAAPVADPYKHRMTFRELLKLISTRPDRQFIIKPHPSFDYYELYRKLKEENLPNLFYFEQATLSEIIEASDLCLMINYCTTASLEAMLHRIPVVYLNTAVYPLPDWCDNLSENGVRRVTTLTELEECIDSVLVDEAIRHQTLVDADSQIKSLLGVEDILATERLKNLIKYLLDDQLQGYTQNTTNALALFNINNFEISQGSKYIGELAGKHTGERLIFVFVYLVGVFGFNNSSIFNIYSALLNKTKNKSIKNWNAARWSLLPVYISGRLSGNVQYNSYGYIPTAIFPYLVHPDKFICAPIDVKKKMIKYFIQGILGRKLFIFAYLINFVRSTRFGSVK